LRRFHRVQYSGWSSHFIEWAEPNRVVEPNENNRLLLYALEDLRQSRSHLSILIHLNVSISYYTGRDA
jgi:hypothetical protein